MELKPDEIKYIERYREGGLVECCALTPLAPSNIIVNHDQLYDHMLLVRQQMMEFS